MTYQQDVLQVDVFSRFFLDLADEALDILGHLDLHLFAADGGCVLGGLAQSAFYQYKMNLRHPHLERGLEGALFALSIVIIIVDIVIFFTVLNLAAFPLCPPTNDDFFFGLLGIVIHDEIV